MPLTTVAHVPAGQVIWIGLTLLGDGHSSMFIGFYMRIIMIKMYSIYAFYLFLFWISIFSDLSGTSPGGTYHSQGLRAKFRAMHPEFYGFLCFPNTSIDPWDGSRCDRVFASPSI